MSTLWLVVLFILGNLVIVGLCVYAFGFRETQAAKPKLTGDAQKAILSLQNLTGELTRRVEGNADELEAVVRDLAALAEMPPDAAAEAIRSLKGSVSRQEAFIEFLKQSGRKLQQHGAQLGVGLDDGQGRQDQCSAANPSGELARQAQAVQRAVDAVIAASRSGGGAGRHVDDREAMSFTMCVMPLDDDLAPSGAPFVAVARDISTGGMSFSHTGPLSAPRLAVRMKLGGVQEICLVMARRHTSRVGPMFITGGAFVCRLEEGHVWQLLLDFAASTEIATATDRSGGAAALAASHTPAPKQASQMGGTT